MGEVENNGIALSRFFCGEFIEFMGTFLILVIFFHLHY